MLKISSRYKAPNWVEEFFNDAGVGWHPYLSASGRPMPKVKRTAEELGEMIEAQLGVGGLSIGIRKDHAYGWQPRVEYAPGNQLGFQRRADEIADRLRQYYELAE